MMAISGISGILDINIYRENRYSKKALLRAKATARCAWRDRAPKRARVQVRARAFPAHAQRRNVAGALDCRHEEWGYMRVYEGIDSTVRVGMWHGQELLVCAAGTWGVRCVHRAPGETRGGSRCGVSTVAYFKYFWTDMGTHRYVLCVCCNVVLVVYRV
jgi:hypothetical protein